MADPARISAYELVKVANRRAVGKRERAAADQGFSSGAVGVLRLG
jgi:hypothetical protein